MQVRPWFIGIAVVIAAAAFFLAILVTMTTQPFRRGMMPPQHEQDQPLQHVARF